MEFRPFKPNSERLDIKIIGAIGNINTFVASPSPENEKSPLLLAIGKYLIQPAVDHFETRDKFIERVRKNR